MTVTRISRATQTGELFGASRLKERPPSVLNKRNFVRRYKAGEFGNASPTWDNLDQWIVYWIDTHGKYMRVEDNRDKYKFHIRNRITGGDTWYDIPWFSLEVTWQVARNRVGERNLYISEMAPHEYNLIQGEVVQGPIAGAATRHLYIWYSRQVGVPMREALVGPEKAEAGGIIATTLLRTLMCPNSWDWLNQLLDNFPGHVVEFSTFSVEWGTIPNFNTCFWEVRGY